MKSFGLRANYTPFAKNSAKPETPTNNLPAFERYNDTEKKGKGSLTKYDKSPYLQSIGRANIGLMSYNARRHDPIAKNHAQKNTRKDMSPEDVHQKTRVLPFQLNHQRSLSNNSNYVSADHNLRKAGKDVGTFRLPMIDREDQVARKNVHSTTLQFSSTKKTKLEPIGHMIQLKASVKTKAGTNGKQLKVNQDTVFVEQKLPFGLKCFCVCDGHGLNGHTVSAFIKSHMLKNLRSALKRHHQEPSHQAMQELALNVFSQTNQSLLDSDINTELSGSTVVAVFHYLDRLFCLNVGDSRAILCQQKCTGIQESSKNEQLEKLIDHTQGNVSLESKRGLQIPGFHKKTGSLRNKSSPKLQELHTVNSGQTNNVYSPAKMHLSKSHSLEKYIWKVKELSIDQKPQRADEKERIIKNGGRVEYNKTDKGENIGPLRVWMKNVHMPGLAMTRSFGDKAGLKAGTCSEAEVIEHILSEDDKFFVVASDGVWEYLENEDVLNLIAPFYKRQELEAASEKVLKVSTQIWSKVSYSRDDISIIIVALNPIFK